MNLVGGSVVIGNWLYGGCMVLNMMMIDICVVIVIDVLVIVGIYVVLW